jgi:hypothetical protein
MIRQLIMTAVLIAAVIPALGQEETCPNPVPDQPTRSQVVACLRNIQSLSGDNIIRAKDLQRPSAEKAFENLRNNTRVNWLIRLITYDPNSLRLSGLTTLGKQTDRFSFVAPYEELRGLPVNTTVTKLGGEVDPKNRVFAIIFPTPAQSVSILYPANARGMLQVVREVESDPTLKIDKALLKGKRELADEEERDLDNHDISSWDFNNYGGSYSKYCVLTHKFQCENPEFSARNYISRISDDWHPLGFSREKHALTLVAPRLPSFAQTKRGPPGSALSFLNSVREHFL